jgi:hypothetical protein
MYDAQMLVMIDEQKLPNILMNNLQNSVLLMPIDIKIAVKPAAIVSLVCIKLITSVQSS